MKKSKVLVAILMVVLICTMLFTLSACKFDSDTDSDNHTHSWKEDWTSDDTYHWHKCMECNATTEKEMHTYSSGKCVCGKTIVATEIYVAKNGLVYELNAEKTAYKLSEIGSAGNKSKLTILDNIYGYPVKTIGEEVFKDNLSLTEISLPNTIEVVEWGAFNGCANLNYANFGNVAYLGNEQNPYLVAVGYLDKDVTECILHNDTKVIADYAFYNYDTLKTINIPNGIKSISCGAFWLSGITSISLPNSVTAIEDYAFNLATSLSEVIFSQNLVYIGNRAFSGASIVTADIPNSVVDIGEQAFMQCRQLTTINLSNKLTVLRKEICGGCFKLTNIIIPDGIVTIEDKAFRSCTDVNTLVIPISVKNIGVEAFNFGLKVVNYKGTEQQWEQIDKQQDWCKYCQDFELNCNYNN